MKATSGNPFKPLRTALFALIACAFLAQGCGESDVVVQSRLAQAHKLYSQRKTDQALRAYKEILADNPEQSGARVMMGKLIYYQRKFKAAEKEFAQAYESDPTNLNALFWLAKAQSLIPGKEGEALKNITRVLDKDDGRIEAWHLKGLLQEARKDLKGALASYRYAVSQGRKLALVHIQLGILYRKARLPEAAEREFRTAETLGAGDANLLKQIKVARAIGIRR